MTELIRVVSKLEGAAAGAELVESLKKALGAKVPALLVCFGSMKQPLGLSLAALKGAFPNSAVLGSSTAGEFTEEGEHDLATVVAAIVGDFVVHTALVEGLKEDVEGAAERAASKIPARSKTHPHRTAILLFDGLAGVGEEATLACASILGTDVPFAGAAAGDDWAIKGTVVGAGDLAAGNALALAVIDSKVRLGIGVAHGHKPLGSRVTVTRAEGSVVHELDGQPAWKRYAELTRVDSVPRHNVDPDSITDSGKRLQFFAWYQTGIDLGTGFKNRTPLARLADDSLAYACGIPAGTEMSILGSTGEAQIESAREAAMQARTMLGSMRVAGALVFECGCRKVYLGNDFSRAPQVVSATLDNAPLAGLESYGEVALNVGDFSGFHNATTVVLAFPSDEQR